MNPRYFEVCSRRLSVLSLRYFVCEQCETVYASPDEPPNCNNCGGQSLREITHDLHSDAYFIKRGY